MYLMPKILIVDDKKINREILKRYLQSAGYKQVLEASSGREAVEQAKEEEPDLVLLDIVMPAMDGYEVCRQLKNDGQLKNTPVIFLSALSETKDKVKALTQGGVDYITKPFAFEEIQARVQTHLKIYYLQKDLERHNKHLEELVQAKVKEISDSQMATIFAIAHLAEKRDYDTGMHLERTSDLCRLLAIWLSDQPYYQEEITDDYVRRLCKTSVLHDIGKVGVPDAVLLKPGKLTVEEFETIKTHTTIGSHTLKEVEEKYPGNKFLVMGVQIARSHHEKWDGSGYPDGLARESIPLAARIMALVDVYDALRSKRPYKKAFSHQKSLEIIVKDRGNHFDPIIVDAFISLEKKFEQIYKKMGDI